MNAKIAQTLSFLALPASFTIFLSLFFLQNQIKDLFSLWENLKQGQILEQQLSKKIENIKSLKSQLSENEKKLIILEKKIPRQKDLPQFLDNLNKISAQNYVSLASVFLSKGIPSKTLKLSSIPLTVVVDGERNNILKFLKSLEKNERFVIIENVDISKLKKESAGFFYRARISLNVYYLGEK